MPGHCSRACGILLGCCTTLLAGLAAHGKIALQDARTILSGGPSTCYTPNLQRTDAHGGATGPIISPNELHLLTCILCESLCESFGSPTFQQVSWTLLEDG
eukprot:scaffold10415_cov23-Phaeocystis_antarctica.AAC.1